MLNDNKKISLIFSVALVCMLTSNTAVIAGEVDNKGLQLLYSYNLNSIGQVKGSFNLADRGNGQGNGYGYQKPKVRGQGYLKNHGAYSL